MNNQNLNHQSQSPKPTEGAFLKAMIKINNPTWSLEQIEQEFKRQMTRKDDEGTEGGCDVCSG